VPRQLVEYLPRSRVPHINIPETYLRSIHQTF
jgi:hypothetical protein